MLYRQDIDEVRARLTTWWNGGDIGRPVLQITAPRPVPIEDIPALPEPKGWTGRYSTRDFAYRVNLAQRACTSGYYLAEAVPNVSPDLAPNCLALYLGCQGVEGEDTVWCEPFLDVAAEPHFVFDKHGFYWEFSTRLAREQLRLGRGKFLTSFPDLIEGLDTLAAMRGVEQLLFDLIERPNWVQRCLCEITDRYFHVYDLWYDLIRDEVGGSHFWAWAPGRMAKFQCDISAMLSPAMFAEFMLPVLVEMCDRVGYCMYHWDGPGAICHHDHLLSIAHLTMIQWTPGATMEPVDDRRWWPLYHKTVEAGKKLILMSCSGPDSLRALKREFGLKLRQFMINYRAESLEDAQEFLRTASE